MPKGLIVSVLREANGSDCTNGGVSSKYNEFVLVDPMLDEVFESNSKRPALKIVRRTIGYNIYVHAEPLEACPSNKVGYMAGGNFVYSCDSRLHSICPYPIPVHDRTETQAQYDRLSR